VSYSVDINLLVYATTKENPFHAKARPFLEQCVRGPDEFALTWATVMGYLRISTHPRILARPLTPQEARANIRSLLAHPHIRLIAEQRGFWPLFEESVGEMELRGPIIPDAHLAVLLLQHGVGRIYTADSDFQRFPFLEAVNPLV
jgi:uncharacterized protein